MQCVHCFIPWLMFMLLTGCVSTHTAGGETTTAVNPTNAAVCSESAGSATPRPASSISEPFAESERLLGLMDQAGIVFETHRYGKNISLLRPTRAEDLPISELDAVLAKYPMRKDLAVIIMRYGWDTFNAKEKTMQEFAIWADKKLRDKGFKRVLFLTAPHGLYQELWGGGVPSTKGENR